MWNSILPIVFQILLAIFGPELGTWFVMKLGGPRLGVRNPSIHDEVLIPPPSQSFNLPAHTYLPSGGTAHVSQSGEVPKDIHPYIPTPKKHFISLVVSNEQQSILEIATAKKVYAKLTFYTLDKMPVEKGIKFDGRWSVSRQPSAYENVEELRFKDILPGEDQPLDIAIRDSISGHWYVWSSSNYNSNDPDKRLPVEGFIFCLKLRGTNCVLSPTWYRFESAGNKVSRINEAEITEKSKP